MNLLHPARNDTAQRRIGYRLAPPEQSRNTHRLSAQPDQSSQRAAWSIGTNSEKVFEAGIYNLTKTEMPALVHVGASRTVQMLLVRIDGDVGPDGGKAGK